MGKISFSVFRRASSLAGVLVLLGAGRVQADGFESSLAAKIPSGDLSAIEPDKEAADALRMRYNQPGLVGDLGVGLYAFPLPLDFDGDGDMDLVVSCPDRHYNGTFFFENPADPGVKMPVFKPGKKIGPGGEYMTLSTVDGKPRVLVKNKELAFIQLGDWKNRRDIYPKDRLSPIRYLRGNTWRLSDLDGDAVADLVVGHDSWDAFGWFEQNDWWKAYDAQGKFNRKEPQGWFYFVKNEGTNSQPKWAEPSQIFAGPTMMETRGAPTPNLADFDGDGDLDMISGEFVDGFTYFENVGSVTRFEFAEGVRLFSNGQPLTMDLCMIAPHVVDWDGDDDPDIICGDEDGRVALIENTGRLVGRAPAFLPPVYFQQEADVVKVGALATPAPCDWDGDGDVDLITGNSAGYLLFLENLSGPNTAAPKWALPRKLEADGRIIRIMAGENGSIQGPIEAKWGYTVPCAADWDGDGLTDLVINSIWGRIEWFRNIGTRTAPRLAAAQPVEVAWPGTPPAPAWNWWKPKPGELVTQWRTTPVVVDWNGDKLADLVMLDHEGYPALWLRERRGEKLVLTPGQRVLFDDEENKPFRFNAGDGGRSGRRKLAVADWDGDGKLDILADEKTAILYRQTAAKDGKWFFHDEGNLFARNLSSHSPGLATADWDGDGVPDLILGAQEGQFYLLKNPRAAK